MHLRATTSQFYYRLIGQRTRIFSLPTGRRSVLVEGGPRRSLQRIHKAELFDNPVGADLWPVIEGSCAGRVRMQHCFVNHCYWFASNLFPFRLRLYPAVVENYSYEVVSGSGQWWLLSHLDLRIAGPVLIC